MIKKDFSGALRKTAAAQRDIIDNRFSKADSVLLGLKGEAVSPSSVPAHPDVALPSAPLAEGASRTALAIAIRGDAGVIRDTFSMPPTDHGLIETLRTRAAREGRNTSKSEIIRAGLTSLANLSPAQLIAVLDGLERVKLGRK